MPRRIPLYLKILFWFFLNLALLVVMFCLLFRAQFHFGMDWLLSDQIDIEGDSIMAELAGEPQADWNASLEQHSQQYHGKARFLAFGPEGILLAGPNVTLPSEVREQLARRRGPPRERMDGENPGPPERPPIAPPRRFIHTSDPSLYWVVKRTMVRRPDQQRPMPLTLLAVSDSFAGGGLFFQIAPWLGMGAVGVLLSILLWLPLVRDLNRAIGQLTSAANQIAEGRFDARVDQSRRDELGSLGQAINQMASRLNDLVAGQKRFLGDVAHELCSPLAKLRVSLGILDQKARIEEKPYVTGAEEEAAHMAGLIDELLSFSRASLNVSNIQLTAVSVREIVEKAIRRETSAEARVELVLPEEFRVRAEPDLLGRALSNLLRNAVRYAGQAGPIVVSARREEKNICIIVADSGPGVPAEELTRIFDPFYRVDASRDRATGGVGLGLAIVKTCIESCGGTVAGRNRSPAGLEVTLRLPEASA